MQTVTVLSKSAPIESLGLSPGVHHLKVVVAEDTVAFELEDVKVEMPSSHRKTGFVAKWSGSARKVEDPVDNWLTHINEKHLES